ncbi:DNA-binding protein [Microlunatus speluncae]|uniref:DNA-binding protein n=1 Tax=Microlunatus speluncae TaxID=2594267 RepID=UPI001266217F|nr:DNA-binding protein [Microlunatus speluncae]
MASPEDVGRVREEQVALYGETLQQLAGRYCAVLGLSQSRLAGLLGISAPMLSQLINGHRTKLANPASGERLRLLHEAVADVELGRLTPDEAVAQVTTDHRGDVLTTRSRPEPRTAVRQIQEVFRLAASADEYAAAAAQVRARYPEVADLLEAYGVARTDDAVRHFSRITTAR